MIESTDRMNERVQNGGPTNEELNVIPLKDEKTYPMYRMLYSEVERIFLEADISVVEAVGILELLKHDIIMGEDDES